MPSGVEKLSFDVEELSSLAVTENATQETTLHNIHQHTKHNAAKETTLHRRQHYT
jgi:hypothetical protein